MKKIFFVLVLFTICIVSQNVSAEIDYDKLQETLYAYEEIFLEYHDQLYDSWRQNPNDIPEDKLRFELYNDAVFQAQHVYDFVLELSFYIKIKPLIAPDKMSEFEEMLTNTIFTAINTLRGDIPGGSVLERSKRIEDVGLADLTYILLQLEDQTRELTAALETFVELNSIF